MNHDRLDVAASNGAASKPVSRLLADSATHARDVVRGEMHLTLLRIRDELREEGREVMRDLIPRVARVAAAFVFATCALVLMITAAVSGLSTYVPTWAARLIVAGVSILLALLLIPHSRPRDES